MNSRANKGLGRIGVLMGGPSTEREISLKSGRAVYESLKQQGLEVVTIDIKTDNIKENMRLIRAHRIDCAFIALHGRFGEDGQIQEILEEIKVAYTCSGGLASKLAMDKIASRRIFEVYGLAVPRYKIWDRLSYNKNCKIYHNFRFPSVVKPCQHGSSIGLFIVDRKQELDRAVEKAFNFDERIMIEDYIGGREVTVSILDDKALPIIEIIPKKRFFDYEAKYQTGMTNYVVPARLKKEVAKKIKQAALSAHRLLGCYGCSRVDIILSKDEIPFVLEVNTIPGLTTTSLLPKAAKSQGIEFGQLCLRLITLAYEKAALKFNTQP